jgi:hypothetical protein
MYRVEYETSSHDINGDDGVLVSRVVEASALARWPPSPRRPRYAGAGASPAPPLPAPGVSGAGSAACAACAAYGMSLPSSRGFAQIYSNPFSDLNGRVKA